MEAAQKVRWFYSPAALFISAYDERALLTSAQLAATGILGHKYDRNWSTTQKALSEAEKAWKARDFDIAKERWGSARSHCQGIVHAAVPLTVSLSPALRDAFVRLAGSDNEQLAVQQGATLSLRATPGHYQMNVEHPDYEPHHEEIVVVSEGSGQVHVHAELTPLPGKLFVQCEPTAGVLRDGVLIGMTGQPLVLPAGEHVVEIAAKHYESVIKTVTINPNGEENINLGLHPLPRKLLAKCEPVAEVLLDGRSIGRTDEDLTVPVGEFKITLVADGYKGKSFNAKVRPGRDVRIDTTLEFIPLPGKLLLLCAPRAEVFADGEFVGVTGQPISLTEGEHRIRLVADGFLERAFTVNIPLGRDVQWAGDLALIPGALYIEATVPDDYGTPQQAPTAKLTIGKVTKTVGLPHKETLPPGEHNVQIDVEGYEEIPAGKVTITSDEWTRMPLTITPEPATVCLVPNPPEAKMDIYIKTWEGGVGRNTKIGKGGQKLELMPFVQHDLIIKAKGYQQTHESFSLPYAGRHHADITVDLIGPQRRR